VGTEDGLRAIITRVAGEVILESQRQAKMNLSSGFNANA
jgi:hypothetical protein